MVLRDDIPKEYRNGEFSAKQKEFPTRGARNSLNSGKEDSLNSRTNVQIARDTAVSFLIAEPR